MRYSIVPNNYSNVPSANIRHAGRHAYIAHRARGEHITLAGDNVTREHCIIESITLEEREET